MDTSLYHDSGPKNVMKSMKSKMTLDFSQGPSAKRVKTLSVNQPALLASPDLQMLKLASPELERLIIQHNDMVTTTPTPTAVAYPKNVTEEQEAYARGFVDALAELHKQQEAGTAATTNASEEVMVPSLPTVVSNPVVNPTVPTTDGPHLNVEQASSYTTLSNSLLPSTIQTSHISLPATTTMPIASIPLGVASQSGSDQMSDDSRTSSPFIINQNIQIKEEPQTVPVMKGSPAQQITPIDMGNQEVIKIERKRARNRQAARKCRTRKLERISRLEDRVDELKGENSSLVANAATLRAQVCELKQQILAHVELGCKMMPSGGI